MGEEKDGPLRKVVGALVNMLPVNRVVALLTPLFVIAAGWIATQVAKYAPGLPGFSKDQLVAFFVAGATAALIPAWQWLRGYSKHEENEAMIEMAAVQDSPPQIAVEDAGHVSIGAVGPGEDPEVLRFVDPEGGPVVVSPDVDPGDHDTVSGGR